MKYLFVLIISMLIGMFIGFEIQNKQRKYQNLPKDKLLSVIDSLEKKVIDSLEVRLENLKLYSELADKYDSYTDECDIRKFKSVVYKRHIPLQSEYEQPKDEVSMLLDSPDYDLYFKWFKGSKFYTIVGFTDYFRTVLDTIDLRKCIVEDPDRPGKTKEVWLKADRRFYMQTLSDFKGNRITSSSGNYFEYDY